jgi:hypothetical protein
LSRIGFAICANSLTCSDAENKNRERYNQPARSHPMVLIPAMLLRLPVSRKGFRRPFGDPVVDGHRTDQRKHDREELDCESDCAEPPCRLVQMYEGQQQQKIQQRGASHPKWHHATKKSGERCAHPYVHFKWLPVENGMRESRYVQFASAHQAKHYYRNKLKRHRNHPLTDSLSQLLTH